MFTLSFETTSSAFSDSDKPAEAARILREIADRLEAGHLASGTVRDVKGNHVGQYRLN